ncbi:MAG TPA: outer membrane beta-barrel protein [Nitrospira sp.]|nr:outer membrane beta-barrel protein [Nitrospira sp.]
MTNGSWCALALTGLAALLSGGPASAEWYVAGQAGVNFADRLTSVSGTGSLTTLRAPDFDLKNAVVYGGKVGNFPGNGPIGLELDVFNSQPNIKNLDDIPGIHLRVTNVGVNVLLRYPGPTYQPYVGIGGAALVSHLGASATTQSDSDVGFGVNLLAGLRAFVTPYIAVFAEYKYTRGTLTFHDAFGSVGGFSGDYKAQHVVFGVSYHFSLE